jgi:hypothetical protein
MRREMTIQPEDPLSAHYRLLQTYVQKREGWDIRIETETVMTSTKGELILTGKLDAFENGKRVGSRNWRESVPRNCL